MSDNPFKIIRPTDQPPESLKKEVMGSVKWVMLIMRFVQLFVVDLSLTAFDKVCVIDPETGSRKKKN